MSSGSVPPSDSDRPCAVMGKRADSCVSCSPNLPPTPIQLSGASSRKSTAPSSIASSDGNRPRRRPRPAEVGESIRRMTMISVGAPKVETQGARGDGTGGLLGEGGEAILRNLLAVGFVARLGVVVGFALGDE